jgi:hypothetical protein
VVYQQAVIDTPPVSVAKPKKHTRRAAPTPVQENGFSVGFALYKAIIICSIETSLCWFTFLATFHKESPLLVGPYSPLTTKLLKPFSCTGVGAARLVCFFGFATDTGGVSITGRAVPEPEPVIVVEPNVESEIQDTSDANTKLTLESPSEEAISQSAALRADATEAEQLVSVNVQLQERLANLEKQFVIKLSMRLFFG